MAKKRKWGPVLAFGAVTAILGGLAAYKHRKEIERTLQEIADQMDAWDGSEEFFHDEDTIVHSVNDTPEEQPDAPRTRPRKPLPTRATLWTARMPPSPTRRQLRKPERLCRPLPPPGRGPLHLFPWVRRETPP